MQAIKCEMCGSHTLTKRKGFLICQNCGTKYALEESETNKTRASFEDEYKDAKSVSKRIDLVYSLKIPNQKEKLLDVFYLAASNVARGSINERKLDEAWQIKLEKAYLKAGDVIDDKKQLVQIRKIYVGKQKEIKKWRRKLFWGENGFLIFTGIFFLIFIAGTFILVINTAR